MYQEIKEQLEKEFPELPKFEEKFNKAYQLAVSIVGTENAQRIENNIRAELNVELEKYLASKPKTRTGKFIRFILNLFKKK